MSLKIFLFASMVFALTLNEVVSQAPPAEFRVKQPRGFEVSIPADPDIELFAFHGKLNEPMDGLEAGMWSADITRRKNGRFTFTDRATKLKRGDVIYFWTYVIRDGRGFRQDNGEFHV